LRKQVRRRFIQPEYLQLTKHKKRLNETWDIHLMLNKQIIILMLLFQTQNEFRSLVVFLLRFLVACYLTTYAPPIS